MTEEQQNLAKVMNSEHLCLQEKIHVTSVFMQIYWTEN